MLFRSIFILLIIISVVTFSKLYTEATVNRISVNVPFVVERGFFVKSDITIDVYAEKLEVKLSDYLKSNFSGAEASLKAILDSVANEDFDSFSLLIDERDDLISILYDQFLEGNSAVSFAESTVLLYKVFIGEDVLFLTETRFMGRNISVPLFFKMDSGGYVLTDFQGKNKIAMLLKAAIHSQYVSKDKVNYINPYFKRNITRQLIGGTYPVAIGFDEEWVVNQYTSDDDKSSSPKNSNADSPHVARVLNFYTSLIYDFSSKNFDQAFNKMDDGSVERLTYGWNKIDEATASIKFKFVTVPRYLVSIVDADPFYLVFGTPFSRDYQAALAEPKDEARINAIGELGLNHYFIRRTNDGDLRVEHFNIYGAENDLFTRRDFIEKIIAPGLLRD